MSRQTLCEPRYQALANTLAYHIDFPDSDFPDSPTDEVSP